MKTLTKVKERPILFSAPMVRAILSGDKTQTRRVVNFGYHTKPRESDGDVGAPSFVSKTSLGWFNFGCDCWQCRESKLHSFHMSCPYGAIGERLWVRETHARIPSQQLTQPHYFADGPLPSIDDRHDAGLLRTYPSIFMPRWASRITLEITDVRVHRLKDISETDASAEGVELNNEPSEWTPDDGWIPYCNHYPDGCECFPAMSAKESFLGLWHKIYGDDVDQSKYWVWAITFKRIEAQ